MYSSAPSDADPWTRICIMKVGSGSVWRNTNPDPGHMVNVQKAAMAKEVIRIRMDPHLKRPPRSESAWADHWIQEVKKPGKCTGSSGEYRTGRSKVRILL